MKKIKIVILVLSLLIIWVWFFQVNTQNYRKHLQIRDTYIEHPENLPTKDSARLTAFGFQNLKADWFWLNAIQYIGGNAVWSEYKKYLYAMLDTITELNPYFAHPYVIGQLLLPSHNAQYEEIDAQQIQENIVQWEQLGLKWIENFCDPEIIDAIDQQDNLKIIWSEEQYKNPCKNYEIPYSLAFVYYFYLNDPLSASKYYKVASANEDALEWAKVMAAIMTWKWWEREKSFFMFLNLASYIAGQDEACQVFWSEFEQLGREVFAKRVWLNGQIIANIEGAREKLFGRFSGQDKDPQLDDTGCISYINKAVREINLHYIEQADARYQEDNGFPSLHAQQLYNDGYIEFLPTDFQQYDGYGIIYEYNSDTQKYDYSVGSYES